MLGSPPIRLRLVALAVAAGVSSGLLTTGDARAEVRLWVSAGASAPLGTFMSGTPVPLIDGCGGQPTGALHSLRADVENDVGLSLAGGVRIGGWEFGYSLGRHTWGTARLTGGSLCTGLGGATDDIVWDWPVLYDAGIDPDDVVGRGGVLTRNFDESGASPLYTHRLLVGYRFFAMDGALRPYIPLAFGAVVMHGGDTDAFFGGNVQLGLGVEYEVGLDLRIGLDVRFSADVMQNPALRNTSLARLATQSVSAADSVFDSVVKVFPALLISVVVDYGL